MAISIGLGTMTKLAIFLSSSIALTIFVGVSQASAASIAIANAGFEEPDLTGEVPVIGNEVFTFETPPSWKLYDPSNLVPDNANLSTSFVGVWDSTSAFFTNEAPEGKNVGAILLAQASGGGAVALAQTLSSTLTANTKYTLQVEVGNPGSPFFAGFPGYTIQLLAGNTVIAEDNNTLAPVEGTFDKSIISFTTSDNDPNLGKQLEIRLFNSLVSSGLEVDFDDVRLTANPVPEPVSTLSLLFIATLGARAVLKRKLSKD
jgi:hapalindole H/12-epi-hapalindole U/12-epi-fischerindole U synthase